MKVEGGIDYNDETFVILTVVKFSQVCIYVKTEWIVYFKYASFTVLQLHLKKVFKIFLKRNQLLITLKHAWISKLLCQMKKSQAQNTQYILYDSTYKKLQKTQNLICSGCWEQEWAVEIEKDCKVYTADKTHQLVTQNGYILLYVNYSSIKLIKF